MTTPRDIISDAILGHKNTLPNYTATTIITKLRKAGFVIVPREASDEMCGMGGDMAEAGAPIAHIWEAMIDVALAEQAK